MGVMSRWLAAVAGALACFGGCWAGLAAERVLDTGSQVGIAAVPFVTVLTVAGAWAERAYEKKPQADVPVERQHSEAARYSEQRRSLLSPGIVPNVDNRHIQDVLVSVIKRYAIGVYDVTGTIAGPPDGKQHVNIYVANPEAVNAKLRADAKRALAAAGFGYVEVRWRSLEGGYVL